jgi:hypothetical protein
MFSFLFMILFSSRMVNWWLREKTMYVTEMTARSAHHQDPRKCYRIILIAQRIYSKERKQKKNRTHTRTRRRSVSWIVIDFIQYKKKKKKICILIHQIILFLSHHFIIHHYHLLFIRWFHRLVRMWCRHFHFFMDHRIDLQVIGKIKFRLFFSCRKWIFRISSWFASSTETTSISYGFYQSTITCVRKMFC